MEADIATLNEKEVLTSHSPKSIGTEVEEKIKKALKDFFGFNSFKGNQEDIINSVLQGRDTFVIMPTGGGKSLCYQLPALVSEGTAIVISPLIALMKNQVDLIQAFGGKTGVAHFLNSSLNKKETEQVKSDVTNGITKMLYLAPESLTKDETLEFLSHIKVPFVAVDEAHCISEWGHDFRPEYRRIRQIVDSIGENVPIIGLTASATPKVQEDILKNLRMNDPSVFKSSFNRPNLYYEVRPKASKNKILKDIISYVKRHSGKSGIIYCLSRKTVEEVAETLRVNGIKALEYHAGMDSNTRAKHQDMFLMEEVDVIVATIAFGMGIDKPDVRFVIHFDVPKSLESYYQETGRGGRDGMAGECIMYYNYKDLLKLEKFLKDKPVAEREIGTQLLHEMAAFAENSSCRRKALLHYFGEEYDEVQCEHGKMCDNHRFPKERVDAEEGLKLVLETLVAVQDKFHMDHIIHVLRGEPTSNVKSYGHHELEIFGEGEEKEYNYWKSVIRQGQLEGMIDKDIESYGTLVITKKGEDFIKNPQSFMVAIDHDFMSDNSEDDEPSDASGNGFDKVLFGLLKELRKKIAKEQNLPPYIIFQDPSLEEMAIKYPINQQELSQIVGVSASKAMRYGKPFLEVIQKYVEENDISRPDDLLIKSVVNRSAQKVYIIQNIDRKISLEDIARGKGLSMEDLLVELENIVFSGTKINLDYYINEVLDTEYQAEVFDYFRKAESDSIDEAWQFLGADVFSREEVQLMRIKFISEMAN
jgi:ATP-dependent DNA helicase RecQ